jgi:hypothetical protein
MFILFVLELQVPRGLESIMIVGVGDKLGETGSDEMLLE